MMVDFEPPKVPNPNKEVFYIIDKKGLYLWKFGKLMNGIGIHPGLHEKYVDCPGIFASQEEAKMCLNKFLESQKETNHAS